MASSPKNKVSVPASSLYSSSSPSIPSRPNPKPRNTETGDLMRRSFRGSPFPADSSRRNSIGRESSRLEFGDKENQNDKDQISNVVRVSKGSKNFMSPTISAVSKINPSPRKKILSDKNELSRSFDKTLHQVQVRSSISFSDVVSIIGEDKDNEQICIDEKKQLDDKESHDITVTDFDEKLENKSNDDSSLKMSHLPPSGPYTFPVFESHEVDPLVAPYDPKKNYLSPRPQFLHYKPNPRIEHHFDESRKLEDLFTSESSSSDTDLSAEESQQEEEVASQESVVAVEEKAEEIQEEVGEEGLEVAESDDEKEEVIGESIEEETHQTSKQSRFKTSKLFGWILVLGVAYLLLVSSVTFTQPSVIKDSPFNQFHISPEILKSARESYEQLNVKLVMWAEASLVYMDKLISSLREQEEYGPFQFHNLTDIWEDTRLSDTVFQTASGEISVAGLLVDSQDWSLEEMDIEEEDVGDQEPEEMENSGENSLEADYEEDSEEVEQESEGREVNSKIVCESNKHIEIEMAADAEVNGGEKYSKSLYEEGNGGQETDDVEGQREYEEMDQKNIEEGHESETRLAQNEENNMEEAESDAHQLDDVESAAEVANAETVPEEEGIGEEAESDAHQLDDVESAAEVANAETVPEEEGIGEIAGNSLSVLEEATDVEHDGNDLEEESGFGEVVNDAGSEGILFSNQKKVVVLFSTVMVLLAAAASFLLAKKKTKPVMLQHEDAEPIISNTKEYVPVENLIKERLSSLNFQEEKEVDDDKKREVSSLPSEMSISFHKSKSLRSCSNRDELKEYQSGGGGKKSNDSGESMASSASEYSIGSVSYGSFTTYEKIQKRSGYNKEEEMVTPVRRSSRIRNHQHSGQ